MLGSHLERGVTNARLLALLPTEGVSVGTPGMPEASLVRLRGEGVRAHLAELEAAGLARQLPGGGWVETARTSTTDSVRSM